MICNLLAAYLVKGYVTEQILPQGSQVSPLFVVLENIRTGTEKEMNGSTGYSDIFAFALYGILF